MKKNESNLLIYDQLRIAAWWRSGSPEDRFEGPGTQLGKVKMGVGLEKE